jgi:hypothetical protein
MLGFVQFCWFIVTTNSAAVVNARPVVKTGSSGYRISVVALVSLPPHKFLYPPLCQ